MNLNSRSVPNLDSSGLRAFVTETSMSPDGPQPQVVKPHSSVRDLSNKRWKSKAMGWTSTSACSKGVRRFHTVRWNLCGTVWSRVVAQVHTDPPTPQEKKISGVMLACLVFSKVRSFVKHWSLVGFLCRM